MTIKKLKKMPYAQAQVRIYTDINGEIYKTILQSYGTDVIMIDKNGYVFVSGLYSSTTSRHISAFCDEYLPTLDYYTIKDMWLHNKGYNKNKKQIILEFEQPNGYRGYKF